MSTLDPIDLAILRTLQANARITNAELAEKVGLSPSACPRRLDSLEKNQIIAGYHARLSPKALDYRMIAIVHISLSGQFTKTLAEFEAVVKRCTNVLVCYLMFPAPLPSRFEPVAFGERPPDRPIHRFAQPCIEH